MAESRSGKLPPYVSYRTFHNFVDGLEQGIPARIDRSYWSDKLSGSTGTQLMVALRFLGLIDTGGAPTTQLKQLAVTKGNRRAEIFREITNKAFWFLQNNESLDLQTATYAQLQEVFHHQFQLTDDVSRKCIKFYVALANDAGVLLSPYITKHFRTISATPGTKTVTKRKDTRTGRKLVVPQGLDEVPDKKSWDEMMITKFPNFDPAWNDEIKSKWFAAFDELLKRGLVK